MTFADTYFLRTDGTFDSDYMIKVSSMVSGMTLTFTNCFVDVRGGFLQSSFPLNIVFDGCTFLVGNTVTLFSLDYSAGGLNGCSSGIPLTQGDFQIRNSVFMDTAGAAKSQTGGLKYLLAMKTLYNVNFQNVTFRNMGMKHLTQVEDFLCSIGDPLKVQ